MWISIARQVNGSPFLHSLGPPYKLVFFYIVLTHRVFKHVFQWLYQHNFGIFLTCNIIWPCWFGALNQSVSTRVLKYFQCIHQFLSSFWWVKERLKVPRQREKRNWKGRKYNKREKFVASPGSPWISYPWFSSGSASHGAQGSLHNLGRGRNAITLSYTRRNPQWAALIPWFV